MSKSIHTNLDPLDSLDRALETTIYMVVVWCGASKWQTYLPQFKHLQCVPWQDGIYDVFHTDTSKARGIQAVLEYYGLTPQDAICIGDGENDIAMMDYCGTSIVMGNASENVKSHGTYITKDIEDDGFAHAIYTWL